MVLDCDPQNVKTVTIQLNCNVSQARLIFHIQSVESMPSLPSLTSAARYLEQPRFYHLSIGDQ